MSGDRGHVIIAGQQYEITDVRLRKNEVQVIFAIRGPVDPFSGPITVVGEDGSGLWQGSVFTASRGVPEGDLWEFHYGMRMAAVLGPRDPAEFSQ